MKPLTGILLAAGALVAAVAVTVYEVTSSSSAAATSPPAGQTLALTGGHTYLITVTPSGSLSATPSQATASSLVGSNYDVLTLTTSPTTVTMTAAVAASANEPATTFSNAVGAPAGSIVTAADQGVTQSAKSPPPAFNVNIPAAKTVALTSADDNATVQANVGDTIQVQLAPPSTGTAWTYTLNGGALTDQGQVDVPGGSSLQTNQFSAVSAGTSTIQGHDGSLTGFGVTVVVS